MKHLTESKEKFVNHPKRAENKQLKFFFFIPNCIQKLFRENHEILLINCIYKINKYKISLSIIIGVIFLSIVFYVDFCFMQKEHHNDYIWVLKTLKRLYDHFNLLYLEIVLFNDDKILTSAFFKVFEDMIKHALYIWYININITINIKK